MQLYLVQHAAPKSKEEDPERPLSEKGWADIRRVAAHLAGHADIQVRQINHSGKARAKQTAEALAEVLQPAEGSREVADINPLADPAIWARQLAEIGEDAMLVGHLPHLSKLAAHLLCRDDQLKVVDFQMGGVVCLSRDEAGAWSIRWMVTPEII